MILYRVNIQISSRKQFERVSAMITKILHTIKKYETIIIHRHERPDPDALGSQLGLAKSIQHVYPKKRVFVVGDKEPALSFLGEMDDVHDDLYNDALVIVCDTANIERISDERYNCGDFLIKIDHHPDDDHYGDLAWVDPEYSSTSEMIVELIKEGKDDGFTFFSENALLLYAGIVGDTGRFQHPNTSADTLKRASLLVAESFDQVKFYNELHKRRLPVLRLQGYVLQHFSLISEKVGVIRLTKELLAEFGVSANETGQMINCFKDVEGLQAWVFFVEDEDTIRVRLRSKGPVINTIAAQHGGGGHPLAAGAKASSWEEADEIVRKLVEATKAK